jgi:aminoglycoside phosphotransferase (APT) family kinase protein
MAPRTDRGRDRDRGREPTYPVGSGLSNETILFQARIHADGQVRTVDLVLRVHPGDFQVYLDPNFRTQFDLLAALHAEGSVRVPEVIWYEDDRDVLGHEFFVMRRIWGRVPVSAPVYNVGGWLADATPAQRRTAWTSAMEQLCRIHLIPVETVSFLDKPELGADPLEQQLSYWEHALAWSTGANPGDSALETLGWLRAHVPDQEPGLSWGDARIGNIMFGDDFEVVGVVDWEQASLGGAMQDLGWWLQMDEHHSIRQGVRASTASALARRPSTSGSNAGRRVDEDLHWHEVFAAFKLMVIGRRVGGSAGRTTHAGVGQGFDDQSALIDTDRGTDEPDRSTDD